MAAPDAPVPFKYTLLPEALQDLKAFANVARERGVAFEFARDLESLDARLRTDPIGWGDPMFDFHHLGMTHYRGLSEFLFANYSVNFVAKHVFVQRFAINPYSQLA